MSERSREEHWRAFQMTKFQNHKMTQWTPHMIENALIVSSSMRELVDLVQDLFSKEIEESPGQNDPNFAGMDFG